MKLTYRKQIDLQLNFGDTHLYQFLKHLQFFFYRKIVFPQFLQLHLRKLHQSIQVSYIWDGLQQTGARFPSSPSKPCNAATDFPETFLICIFYLVLLMACNEFFKNKNPPKNKITKNKKRIEVSIVMQLISVRSYIILQCRWLCFLLHGCGSVSALNSPLSNSTEGPGYEDSCYSNECRKNVLDMNCFEF